MPVRHGEGRVLFASDEDKKKMEENKQIVFRYSDAAGNAADSYPANPTGSTDAIAGVCNGAGNVLGLMPHPERHVSRFQHPNWPAKPLTPGFEWGDGFLFWKQAVTYAKTLLN